MKTENILIGGLIILGLLVITKSAKTIIREEEQIPMQEAQAQKQLSKRQKREMIEKAMKERKPNTGSFMNLPDDTYPWLDKDKG